MTTSVTASDVPVTHIVCRILSAASLVLLTACSSLEAPESAEFDASQNRQLISDVSGGKIMVRNADGKLKDFTKEPIEPYGIELLGNVVLVVDSRSLKGYDGMTGKLTIDLAIDGARALNGITSDGHHTVYVSDSETRRIHAINFIDPALPTQAVVGTTDMHRPNGLHYDSLRDRLLIASWGANASILELALDTSKPESTVLVRTRLKNLDGITVDCNGAVYVSAWAECEAPSGCLARIDPPVSAQSNITVVATGLSDPADLDFNDDTGEIIIPESGAGRVSFYSTGCDSSG